MKRLKRVIKFLIRPLMEIYFSIPLVFLMLSRKLSGKIKNTYQSLCFNSATAFAKIFSKFSEYYCTIELLPKYAEDVIECNLLTDTKKNEWAMVLQGPVSEFTVESIRIYRKIFPKAVIIVSTWNYSDSRLAEELKSIADEVLLNEPPKTNGICNVNYQTKSSYEGMKRAYELGITYAMKLRTDNRIYAPMLFEYMKSLLEVFPVEESSSYRQKERIIVLPGRLYPYWLSDQFYFGTSWDLMNFFDFPQDKRNITGMTTPELGAYVSSSQKYEAYGSVLGKNKNIICYAPEVYMAKSYIQRTSSGGYDSTVKGFWESMRKRFLVVSDREFSLYLDKYDTRYVKSSTTMKYGFRQSDKEFSLTPSLFFPLIRDHLLYENRIEENYSDIIELFPSLGSFCQGYEHIGEVLKDLPKLKGDDQN